MSIKNSTLHKMARREYKKMKKQNYNKESIWVKMFNKYGMLYYRKVMVPRREKNELPG